MKYVWVVFEVAPSFREYFHWVFSTRTKARAYVREQGLEKWARIDKILIDG